MLFNILGDFYPCNNVDINLTKIKQIKIGAIKRMQGYKKKEDIFVLKIANAVNFIV